MMMTLRTGMAFCETMAAYVYHVRPLTDKGLKPGGGCDTLTVCGKRAGWDVTRIQMDESEVCQTCKRVLLEQLL